MAKPWLRDFWFSRSDMWRSLPSDSPRISAELVACSITNRRLCLQKILELMIKLCGDAPLEFFLAKNSNKHETNRGHATPSTQLAKVPKQKHNFSLQQTQKAAKNVNVSSCAAKLDHLHKLRMTHLCRRKMECKTPGSPIEQTSSF